MGKQLFIAEKPSVAAEYARTLGASGSRRDGYIEDSRYVITWCFGHLVTMSYPDRYDPSLKKWSLESLPFLPREFKYEIASGSAAQFGIVSGLLARPDIDRIYVCTDSGREGEYIYRLVELMSDPSVMKKERFRVWIDSFTDEEIKRGISEAKPLSEYDDLSDAAFLRAKEDYLMGINFSRVLTLRYGRAIADRRKGAWSAIAVGRVMTCVLGMVVRREREIRSFTVSPFYRVIGDFEGLKAEWRSGPGSRYEDSPKLFSEKGFREKKDAEALIAEIAACAPCGELAGTVTSTSRKKEKKNPPLLFNLAELQNECSRRFHISPDETLKAAQELYEKKLTTYPRTDARVISSAVAKEIAGNIRGLSQYGPVAEFAKEVLDGGLYKGIGKSRYTDDSAITDHYAIIPTGQGLSALSRVSAISAKVYDLIARRFLSIFYPPAVYSKLAAVIECGGESFYYNERSLIDPGYLKVTGSAADQGNEDEETGEGSSVSAALRKGMKLGVNGFEIKEGKTTPPKRYTSGSMILAMENAGSLIEDESLREQIKGSGIGTSATRAEILSKLVRIGYIKINKKTQVMTPELLGEMVFDVVVRTIPQLLAAELTASWERGLTGVAGGDITSAEYMEKLEAYVRRRTDAVKAMGTLPGLDASFREAASYYVTGRKRNKDTKEKEEAENGGT